MSEYDHEPTRGLPGVLPPGETILWQGSPDWRQLVLGAFHIRLTALYFAGIAGWAAINGDTSSAVGVAALGLIALAMFATFAWGVGRTTVYTLTDKRLVLRIGIALNKCINLPLGQIESAQLKQLGQGRGSIVLALKGAPRLGYLLLWPHARTLRIARPQPMLRAVPDASGVAQLLLTATQKLQAVAPAAVVTSSASARPLVGVPA